MTGDPFKDAQMFWQMCPHYYRNEDLYQAFKSRLRQECSVVERGQSEDLSDGLPYFNRRE